jgi:hypothetical protein
MWMLSRKPQYRTRRWRAFINKSAISSAAKGVGCLCAENLLALLRRQPIPDTHSQPPDALHTPNACRKIRAKKSAIGCFIRQPAYRRQSQVNRRRGLRVRLLGEIGESTDNARNHNGSLRQHRICESFPMNSLRRLSGDSRPLKSYGARV